MTLKNMERWKIEDFLVDAKYQILDCKPSERPDFVFAINRLENTEPLVVGIEHTDYYNDSVPGQSSPGQLLYDFWGNVTTIVEKRVSDKSEFHNVSGRFKLDKRKLEAKAQTITSKEEGIALCTAFADQLSDLVNDFLSSDDEECSYCNYRRMPENMVRLPDVHMELHEYFLQIDLRKVSFWQTIRYGWHANVNASCIGLSASKLAEIVRDKKDKCKGYCTDDIDELWLLVAAPATTVYSATPNHPGVMGTLKMPTF